MPDNQLLLASASPRRQEILAALGLRFCTEPVAIDETRLEDESPERMVLRLAREKALAAQRRFAPGLPVLGADTAVTLDDQVFGKPRDAAHACHMLGRLSGREHDVLTGVAVVSGDRVATAVSRSIVRFRDIDPAEAMRYWHSGEPEDKAGGYAIQGLGGLFVSELQGSYSGVVGLPVFETAGLLADFGVDILESRIQDRP